MKRKFMKFSKIMSLICFVLMILLFSAASGQAASPAGYSEYFIPGDEDIMGLVWEDISADNIYYPIAPDSPRHTIITVVAWSPDTTIYYDHWENGYNFNPNNPDASADEKYVLATPGSSRIFESSNIPVNPRGTDIYYDGRDRIYVAGGVVTVTRTSWEETYGTVFSLAWEVYPVKPQMIKYIMPFGDDLSVAPRNYLDFLRVYALIQATKNNTVVTFDVDKDGVFGDTICISHDNPCTQTATQVTLNAGEVFLLDRFASYPTTGTLSLETGTVIAGTDTLQVNYIAADPNAYFEARGFSAFPSGLWDNKYYAPVPTDAGANFPTQIYLFNPHSSGLMMNYQTSTASGSFIIPAGQNRSFSEMTGGYVPEGSGVYLTADNVFWGVSTIDTQGQAREWGYPLVPSFLLGNEHFFGWAPGAYPPNTSGNQDDSGIFFTPMQDNTRVFVDTSNNGIPDQIYTLNRLQTQYVYDPTDGDMSNSHIWATGPIAIAYGQNPDFSIPGAPSIDLGYVSFPGGDFIEKVLKVSKAADPVVVATTAGVTSTYTLLINSFYFSVDSMSVTDLLPAGWQYVNNSTTINLANQTTVSGAAANPGVAGQVLTWPGTLLGSMAPNQTISITFTAQTTQNFNLGEITRNYVEARGSRTVGGATQTFVATDFAFNTYGDMTVSKISGGVDPLTPGQEYTYTVTVANPSAAILTGISVYDPIPAGVSYVEGSGSVTCVIPGNNVRDEFSNVAYTNNNGSANWSTNWTETDSYGSGSTGATGGFVWITGGHLQFRYLLSTVGDQFDSADYSLNTGSDNWHNNWTESATLDGSPNTVANRQIYITNNRLRFDRSNSATNFHISRTVNVTGANSVTIQFTPYDEGIGSGEAVIAEYSVDGGGFTPLGTFDGGTPGWSGVVQTYNIPSFSGSPMTLRFRATGAWNHNNDHMDIDNVLISYNSPANSSGTQIQRTANLTSASDATLSFSYTGANLDSGDDIIAVEASSDGASFTTLETFNGTNGTSTRSYDISNYISANTTIRFRITSGFNAINETFSIDNVDITYGIPSTFNSGNPPNMLSRNTNCVIQPGDSLTLTYSVAVDDPLGTGIEQITNTAYVNSNEIILPVSASATNIVVNPGSLSASVSGYVWLDTNRNGERDIGEPGLSNVEVNLKNWLGASLMTTITNSAGNFIFSGVAPGTDYYIEINSANLPSGLEQTAPSGRSDNRTNSFNLTAGQLLAGADLGYAASSGTATFGDLVWSDFDGNGIRNMGEPGLTGVTVQLWLDNGDLLWDPDTDTLVTSTITAAGGYYLFTGVTATGSEDYFIFVDPLQALLTDFVETTTNPLLVKNVGEGTVIVNLDFGFSNPAGTYTIVDRLWSDLNKDGQDEGEPGIGEVTVDLLDASRYVIASTITDTNGYFSFKGVTGDGADYTVLIRDSGGVLTDYYGITTSAISGELKIDNLAADRDFTTAPHFGYGLSKSVSGRVFNDLNGNGIPDSGEPGLGGITVSLYNDVNGNGLLDGPDTLQSTIVTDSKGNYIFSGLNDGNYLVNIQNPPSGYIYTTESPDNDPAPGDQQAAAIIGGGNVQNLDFGYLSSNPRSFSGILWNDTNADGIVDSGESGIEGVTLELFDGSTVIALTVTDLNGSYSFPGLTIGNYTLRVTDNLGVLDGYEPTYEFDVGTSGPFDGMGSANLSGGDQTAANFGFRQGPVITLALISDFRAYVVHGEVVLSWDTVFEKGTLGFYIYRLDEASGSYLPVNDRLIPGLIFAPRGGSYRFIDNNALPGRSYSYLLVEIEAKNMKEKSNTYGPFNVTAIESWGQHSEDLPVSSKYSRMERPYSDAAINRITASSKSLKALQAKNTLSKELNAVIRNNRFATKIKLHINERGLYYIDFKQLPFVTGIGPRSNALFISNQILLKNRGRQVPYFIANDNKGIYFYAEDIESPYTDKNVYWVERGRGNLMPTLSGGGPVPVEVSQTFLDTVHIEQNTLPVLAFVNDPASDFWTWGDDFVYAGEPGLDIQNFTFSVYGVGVSPVDESAMLTVELLGLTDTEHHAEIWLNDALVGECRWSGISRESFTFKFNQSLIKDMLAADNTITVRGILDKNVPYSYITVDSFDINYHRKYDAVNNALIFSGGPNNIITVEGFSSANIHVLDISDAKNPKRIDQTTIDSIGPENYRASFVPSAPQTLYLVASAAGMKTPVDTIIDTPSSLKSRWNYANYIIITPKELKSTAESLAKYRQTLFRFTKLVDVEDIMDEFNDGIFSPEAIRSFLAYAYNNWFIQPRYAVLIGEGTYDYKDFDGAGGNLLPPLLVSTPDGLVASDAALGDIDGDGLPEIAVGRLPVLTTDELTAVINKIRTYESGTDNSWRNRIVMIADHSQEGADFPMDSDSVAELLPHTYQISKIYMSQQSLSAARTMLMNAFLNGAGLINYIGHGGPDRLQQYGLLLSSDVDLLTNKYKLPVLTAMTCAAGDFSHPGYDSLAELLLTKDEGGAIAVWSPSGYSSNEQAVVLDKEFFRSFFLAGASGRRLIGDVVLESLGNARNRGVSDFMLQIYNIIGDPALILK